MKRKTIAQLELENKELRAQLVNVLTHSLSTIDSCSTSKLFGSGVLLELTLLGGKKVIGPTFVRDGLSCETIQCLKADINKGLYS